MNLNVLEEPPNHVFKYSEKLISRPRHTSLTQLLPREETHSIYLPIGCRYNNTTDAQLFADKYSKPLPKLCSSLPLN